MQWSNYLYANGGQYYEEGTWEPTLDSPEAIAALEAYKTNLGDYGPPGAASFGFDEAFNVAAQGNHPIERLEGHPGSCLGAAYVAGAAVDAFPGWDDIARYVRPAGVLKPSLASAEPYARHHALYRELYERLAPFYPRLAET